AKDGGYQVWLEMVSDTGEMGFYFVEGEIQAVNGKEIAPEFETGVPEDGS
ncbi:unnamed protein product, partial [marine sediment metagenome]